MAQEPITQLLLRASEGDQEAFAAAAAWAYRDLERLAGRRLRRRFGRVDGLTLEPAALVNETFAKLLANPVGFENRRHFLAIATKVMMGALIDYQRARSAAKRGGGQIRVTLSGLEAGTPASDVELIGLRRALEHLDDLDPRKAEVVRLRVFWGATMEEIATILEISVPTVERDWRFARLWLADALEPDDP